MSRLFREGAVLSSSYTGRSLLQSGCGKSFGHAELSGIKVGLADLSGARIQGVHSIDDGIGKGGGMAKSFE